VDQMVQLERQAGWPEQGHLLTWLLRESGIRQLDFARLGGWTPGAVNRWCRQRPTDAREVPRSAIALALAWYHATPRQRRAVLDALGEYEAPPDAD
jgi:hypothetical protein